MGLEQLSIISVLSKGFNRELTINQLSKSIKRSYASTNQHTHSLIKKNILNKKAVGSAILCLLNLKNEETIAHLIFNSMGEKKRFAEGLSGQRRAALEDFITKASTHPTQTIFLEGGIITVVSDKKHNSKVAGFTIKTISPGEFESSVKKINFEDLVILANYEAFWRAISKAVQ